ncbi:MAG: hypothetical protein HQL03_15680 [Nitrospirae bacterium]|nr:hypothetical protein [Nitrospirota bacterium]MBF0592823.1 hypothetical protein [Nitrospirota bacterium]
MDTSIDTLKIYERLKDAGLNEQAAKALAEIFIEVFGDCLETKVDNSKDL